MHPLGLCLHPLCIVDFNLDFTSLTLFFAMLVVFTLLSGLSSKDYYNSQTSEAQQAEFARLQPMFAHWCKGTIRKEQGEEETL